MSEFLGGTMTRATLVPPIRRRSQRLFFSGRSGKTGDLGWEMMRNKEPSLATLFANPALMRHYALLHYQQRLIAIRGDRAVDEKPKRRQAVRIKRPLKHRCEAEVPQYERGEISYYRQCKREALSGGLCFLHRQRETMGHVIQRLLGAMILAGVLVASAAWAQAPPDLSQLGTLPIDRGIHGSTTTTLGTDRTFATCPDGWTLVMRPDMTPSCAWVLKDAEWR